MSRCSSNLCKLCQTSLDLQIGDKMQGWEFWCYFLICSMSLLGMAYTHLRGNIKRERNPIHAFSSSWLLCPTVVLENWASSTSQENKALTKQTDLINYSQPSFLHVPCWALHLALPPFPIHSNVTYVKTNAVGFCWGLILSSHWTFPLHPPCLS